MAKDPDGKLLPLVRAVARQIHPHDPKGASGLLKLTKPLDFHPIAPVRQDQLTTAADVLDGGMMVDGRADTSTYLPPHPPDAGQPSATLSFDKPMASLKRVDVQFIGAGAVRAVVPYDSPFQPPVMPPRQVSSVVCQMEEAPTFVTDAGVVQVHLALKKGSKVMILPDRKECSVDPWLVGVSSVQVFSGPDGGIDLHEITLYGERAAAQGQSPPKAKSP
jgi:hypothetical protein